MPVLQQITRPQTVFIHKDTTNQSFLDMHYYLKNKGIQNNDFFLALLDTDLRGVDPRDPNLNNYMRTKVLRECMLNYWYFLREVVRIPEQGGDVNSGARYKLHRGNLAMNFLFILNFNMFVEMPRQHGKTIAALCRYLWIYNFGSSNSKIMFLHKDHPGSRGNLKILKSIRDALPSYLQMASAVGQDGKRLKVPNTVNTIQHPFNKNEIVTYASARTKEAANNLGRGATMPCQYYDEFAFIPYNKEVYLAAIPAFSTASQNAKRNGAPYGILLTTTPGDLLTDSGTYAYNIRNNATPWLENYYDFNFEQLQGLEASNKENPFFLISYTYQQLGSGQEYFMRMVKEMNREWPAIRREVMLEWAETATNCPFSQEDLDIIKQHLKEPIRTILFGQFGQYQFNIYEDIDLAYPPIIGVDVSGATFNDSSAITVIDSHTTRVGATLCCNYIPADDLADVIYQLIIKYMPSAIVNIERNGGFGISVIQRLCKTSIKKNLYWEVKDRVIEEAFNGVRMMKRNQKVKVYGLNSTKEVRARLIEILMERVRYHKDKFICPTLHHEMAAMEVKTSGKVEHSANSHDDQVFSYLMALYVWYDGKNLAENFHIMKNTLRTDAEEDLEELEIESSLERREKIDPNQLIIDEDNEEKIQDLTSTLEWVEAASKSFLNTNGIMEQQINELNRNRINMINNNPSVRQQFIDETGVDSVPYINQGSPYINLPASVFGISDDEIDFDDDGNPVKPLGYVQGNLANMFNKL